MVVFSTSPSAQWLTSSAKLTAIAVLRIISTMPRDSATVTSHRMM